MAAEKARFYLEKAVPELKEYEQSSDVKEEVVVKEEGKE